MIRVYTSFYEKDPEGRERNARREHRIGRELLSRGLKELYGLDAVLLEKEKNGKPYLKDRPDIHFNISHCSGLVVCAFADQPVGVDAEIVKPVRDPLIRRVLHEREIKVLGRYGEIAERGRKASGPGEESRRSREFLRLFFRYWTLKESWLKQDGSGLTKEPRDICFFVDPSDWTSPVHASDPGRICLQRKMEGRGDPAEEYIVSVCVPVSPDEPVPGSGQIILHF